jgi:hypothetical protein
MLLGVSAVICFLYTVGSFPFDHACEAITRHVK